jgi:hypothetical protein
VGQPFCQLAATLNASVATDYINFDLVNGTITASGATATGKIQNCGGGIYRLSMTFTSIAVPTAGPAVILYGITNGVALRGEVNSLLTSIDATLGQQEAGAFCTSVIPTFGVAATRAVESCNTPTAGWLTEDGTMVVEFTPPAERTFSRRLFVVRSSGTITDSQALSLSPTGNAQGISNTGGGGNDFGALAGPAVTPANSYIKHKMAISYSGANTRTVIDGGTIAVDATRAVPVFANLTVAYLGMTAPSTNSVSGHWLSRVSFYPTTSFTDAQLQALTS